MIKEDNYISLYDYEIKKGKLLLFNFAFSKSSTQENTYRLVYDIHFDNIEKKFKNDENGLYAKGLLARIFSKFHQDFKIKPLNEKQGFDFLLDIEFTQKITESEWVNVFKLYREAIENILKNQKILLTRETINGIINYFESDSVDKSVENMIVIDSKSNKIYEVKNNVEVQDKTTLGLYLTDKDILEIERMKSPIIIHNHSDNLTFSKEDYVVYGKLKEVIKKKFLFMVYNVNEQSLKEIKTNTVFS